VARHLSWKQFNAAVLDEEDEKVLLRWLTKLKQETRPHLQRMIRVHSRLNKLRAARERKELEALVSGKLVEITSKEQSA
jgi:hypothetical protein